MTRPRVGFVIQRFGPEVLGGAENLCREIARHLAEHWDIEVLTTCAKDYMTWADHFQPGADEVEGIRVRRFAVDRPRDVDRFNQQNKRIVMRFHSFEAEQRWMELQGPKSHALQNYLTVHRDDYAGFVLFNYLYATTHDSIGKLNGRFYLVPFAHDEPPIYNRIFDAVFQSPRGIVFCTQGEAEFARERFPFALPPSEILGMGVDVPTDVSAQRFRVKYDIHEPFMLYAGRIDESKGCDALLEDFIAYREQIEEQEQNGDAALRPLSLVLCGSSQLTIPARDDIRYLGFVDEGDKWDAMAAARFFVLPSWFESLSIVLLEAWAAGTPVLVNGHCAVSVGQCRRSEGGLWYKNRDEFCAAADWLARDDGLRDRLARSGRVFVRDFYQWPKIIERYREFIRFD